MGYKFVICPLWTLTPFDKWLSNLARLSSCRAVFRALQHPQLRCRGGGGAELARPQTSASVCMSTVEILAHPVSQNQKLLTIKKLLKSCKVTNTALNRGKETFLCARPPSPITGDHSIGCCSIHTAEHLPSFISVGNECRHMPLFMVQLHRWRYLAVSSTSPSMAIAAAAAAADLLHGPILSP